jgi:hypothetical protein
MNESNMGRSCDTYGFCGTPERNVPLGRVKCSWDANTKMFVKEIR